MGRGATRLPADNAPLSFALARRGELRLRAGEGGMTAYRYRVHPSSYEKARLRRQEAGRRVVLLPVTPEAALCSCGCGHVTSGETSWRTGEAVRFLPHHNLRGAA